MPVAIELSEDARLLIEFFQTSRRLGRLEAALPQSYAILRDAPNDGRLHDLIDQVFTQLFDHLKS